ncbi:lipocalin family protein [Aquimarina algiphila]|uniref:Lipocalin family protein n=1 Tax=Aquimarina algiphila TaxID=2047982 RepID=A0A554VJX8_9FLAO|nr:lipocalin family protein [Aquimarina algiphila]TSE08272.1 lipocalin family protein [Aquimarina algiphila]
MKKFSVFILLFTSILMSCNSDDDNPQSENPESTSKLIGKWGEISFSQQGEMMTITDCEKRSTIEFSAQSYTDIGYAPVNTDCQIDYQDTGTWNEDGNKLTLTYTDEGETIVEEAVFTIIDDILTIEYDDEGFKTEFGYKKL